MLSRLREHFGSAGLVVAIVALVAALAGGAIAANGGGGKATASAKGKPGPRGKTGKTGPAGPQGPAGPAGPAGAKGDAGAPGSNGSNGAPGAAGKSVVVGNTAPGCAEGGASVQVEGVPASKQEVCNGAEGEPGEPGEPWTAGGTLPQGATETGAWAFNASEAETEGTPGALVPISFAVPLSAALAEGEAHYQSDADFATHCGGNFNEPSAPSGELCVYTSPFGGVINADFVDIFDLGLGAQGTSESGALLLFTVTGTTAYGSGAWAVTG